MADVSGCTVAGIEVEYSSLQLYLVTDMCLLIIPESNGLSKTAKDV